MYLRLGTMFSCKHYSIKINNTSKKLSLLYYLLVNNNLIIALVEVNNLYLYLHINILLFV